MATDIEPGSWRVVERETTLMGMRSVEIWHNGLSIASLNMRHYPSALENGRRMAAAPDMIDALYKSCAVFGLMHDSNILPEFACEAWAHARAALAKARGETP